MMVLIVATSGKDDDFDAARLSCGAIAEWTANLEAMLENPETRAWALREHRHTIAAIHRAIKGLGPAGSESARHYFFSIIEEAATTQLGGRPATIENESDLEVRRQNVARSLTRFVRRMFAMAYPDLARKLTDDLIVEGVNACVLAKPGRPRKDDARREPKFDVLMRLWKTIEPSDSAGASTAKQSMRKPRKDGRRKR